MENPEAVILSTIESLDRWLLKKTDPWEHSYERLGSLVVAMADFGEENKENILSSMAAMADSWVVEKESSSRMDDPWRYSKERMHRLVFEMMDLDKEERMKKMQSLVVKMAEFLVDTNNKAKLFSLLFRVACPRKRMKKDNMVRLLAGITDICVDDAENLDRLLFGIAYNSDHYSRSIYDAVMYDLVAEMAAGRVWKLNKEKLYAWLANWVPCWRKEQKLFGLLLDIARFEEDDSTGLTRENVEEARDELRFILDFITDHILEDRYFTSDAAEMADDARRLIQLRESDPFILLLQMFIFQDDECISRHASQFSEKMMLICIWLQETKERMLELGDEMKAVGSQHDSGKDSNYVAGLEKDINLLLHKEDTGTIIFIRGMIGIGKTTLSRELYDRAIVDGRFERRAWVRVSRKFSRKQILVNIFMQVVKIGERDASFESMDNKSLRHMVRQHLEGKRYFIVLDDVWDEAYLKYFVEAFPEDKGSRLLLTTSNMGIQIDYQTDFNHHMQFLDDVESWKLLLNTVFSGATDEKFPKGLEQKGREMLRKCNGLPIAIIEVGRQWANKRKSGIAWEEILNEAPSLSETLMEIESIYQSCQPDVKSVILHLALFKEGTTIKATRMKRILIVLGVEIGWNMLFSLSLESIIQVKDMDKGTSGTVRTCTINAVFHTLSIQKAKNELGFEIIEKNGNHLPSHEARHRAIWSSREKFPSCSTSRDKYLVSLFFRGGGYFDASPSYWEQFEQLKILDMEDFGLKILPDAVGLMLSELRYLGLRNNYIQELPRSLARLKKLEVLDITLNFMVLVPDIIWDMDSLRCIFISDIVCDKPLKKNALKKLGISDFLSVDNWTYEKSYMKKTDLFRLSREEISLGDWKDCESLILRGFRFRTMPALDELGNMENLSTLKLHGNLTRLSAKNFPINLRRLTLVNSCLDEDPMPILEKLFNLYYLKLENAYTGQQMVISPRRFPKLEYMDIGGLRHLRNLQVGKGAMQNLRQLEIYSCPYLEILPEEILSIESLEKLKIVTTKRIATKIRESGFVSKTAEVDIQP